MQVVAAGAGIHIQHFARKIQAGAQLALHGFGVNLFGIHAASRNHRVLQIAQFTDGHLPVLAQVYQCHLLFAGDLGGTGGGVNAPLFNGNRPHRVGQQLFQCTLGTVAAKGRKVAGQAVIQCFFIQGRLQVKLCNIAVQLHIINIGRSRKHQRAGDAKVSEKCFALLSKQRFAVFQQGQGHVAQA